MDAKGTDNRRRIVLLVAIIAGAIFLVQAVDLWALASFSPAACPASLDGPAGAPGDTYLPVNDGDELDNHRGDIEPDLNFAIVGDGGELGAMARRVVQGYRPFLMAQYRDNQLFVSLHELADALDLELRRQPGRPEVLVFFDTAVLRIRPGSDTASSNLHEVSLRAAPYIEEGTLMVPVRRLAEAGGIDHDLDGATRVFHLRRGDRTVSVIAFEDIFALEVSRSRRELYVEVLDEQVKTYPMCIGAGNNTPVGRFHIQNRAVWPPWRAYWGEYIPGGSRRNPLGARWLGTTARGHERGWPIGIHGTNQPTSIGRRISGGCMRMYNRDAIELYNNIPVGTTVWIHE